MAWLRRSCGRLQVCLSSSCSNPDCVVVDVDMQHFDSNSSLVSSSNLYATGGFMLLQVQLRGTTRLISCMAQRLR